MGSSECAPTASATNEADVEAALIGGLGTGHKWVKSYTSKWVEDEEATEKAKEQLAAIVSLGYPGQVLTPPMPNSSYWPAMPNKRVDTPQPPVGRTGDGKDIYLWLCKDCDAQTYSDEPAPGECKGKSAETDMYVTASSPLFAKHQNYHKIIPSQMQNTTWGYTTYSNNTASGAVPIPKPTTGQKVLGQLSRMVNNLRSTYSAPEGEKGS